MLSSSIHRASVSSIIAWNSLERCEMVMSESPMPSRSSTAFAVFSRATWGSMHGPALKLCFFITKRLYALNYACTCEAFTPQRSELFSTKTKW